MWDKPEYRTEKNTVGAAGLNDEVWRTYRVVISSYYIINKILLLKRKQKKTPQLIKVYKKKGNFLINRI